MGLIGDILHTVGIHWFAVGGEALRRKHRAERALSQLDWDSSGILDALAAVDPCLYYNVRGA